MSGTYKGFQTGKNELSQFGYAANSFGYVSFELDGASYTIPVYANNGKIPGKEQICTKEQIDELGKYMSAAELDAVKYFWFTPLVSVDGEVQSYMFSWESGVMYGRGAAVPGMITPKDHTMFKNYDDLLQYVKSHPELYGRTNYTPTPEAEIKTSASTFSQSAFVPKQEPVIPPVSEPVVEMTSAPKVETPAEEAEQEPVVEPELIVPDIVVIPESETKEKDVDDEESEPEVEPEAATEPEPAAESDYVPAKDSEVVLTNSDYVKEAEEHKQDARALGLNIVQKNEDGSYNAYYNNTQYKCMWDPIEHKWLTYDPNGISEGRATDTSDKILVRISKILAALRQGLHFTSNINVCKDDQGNYYEFDETSGKFIKKS